MGAVTFRLKADPTFRSAVEIECPGGAKATLELELRHMTRAQLAEFGSDAALASRDDVQTIMAIVAGWHNVEDPFTKEAVEVLVDNYHGVAGKIVRAWSLELVRVRQGN